MLPHKSLSQTSEPYLLAKAITRHAEEPAMSTYAHIRDHYEQAALEFGRMLRRWRVVNGWTQYTARNWATEAGHSTSSHSGLSELERGLTKHPRAPLFVSLAEMNERIHQADFRGVTTRDLLDQLKGSRSIDREDGTPWNPADFWSCHVGLIAPPAWLALPQANPAPELSEQQAAELCEAWAKQAREHVRLVDAASADLIRARASAPAAARAKWLNVLLGLDVYTPKELEKLWDAEKSELAPVTWLNSWAATLTAPEGEGGGGGG